MLEFKKQFIEKYSKLTNFNEYSSAIEKFIRKSIRTNTLKISVKALKSKLNENFILDEIPWSKESFYIKEKTGRRDIGNRPEHKQGLFFVQSSASLLPSIILAPKPHEILLDMAASPGAKTTHLASLMQNTGIIIANDLPKRLSQLLFNLRRLGVVNTIVTSGNALDLKGSYDKILLDAPCSASGIIYGQTENTIRTLKEWNPATIKRLSNLQKKLLLHAFDLLKPNGDLVYSTCSLEPEEDEEVIKYLLNKKSNAELIPIDKEKLKIKADSNYGIKIWPHYNETEGFFISKIKKL